MRRFLLSILLTATAALPLAAQSPAPNSPDPVAADDDTRGVARVSVIQGDVSIKRGDAGEVTPAALNAPMVVQDRLLTGQGARAEVQFDYSNMIRVSANSEVRLAELQAQRYMLNIPIGLVTYRVWQNSDSQVDINTPSISVRPLRRGEYRIYVREDGSTEVTVREGEADLYTPQGSRRLGAGRTVVASNTTGPEPVYNTSAAIPLDAWDQWNRARDGELARSRSQQYLPQGVYGAESLDSYGSWNYAAPYGYVWRPNVAADWAPYRSGRWVWVDYYGWTWQSYDPWGWAPYHYGRWFFNAGSWCWWPGAIGPRYHWSPALVTFFGFGRAGIGVGFGFGWGNVGWVPLAPYEPFYRWWGRGYYGYGGNRVVNNVTIINNTNIYNNYRNARVNGGVSYVEAQHFNRGVGYNNGQGYQAARGNEFHNAALFQGPVGIAPTRESTRFAGGEGVRGGVTGSREDVRFASRREAAPVERVGFEQQRQSVQQMARGSGFQENAVRGGGNSGAQGFVDNGGVRGGSVGGNGFVRGGESPATVTGGSQGYVQRGGERGGETFVQRGGGNSDPNAGGGVRGGWNSFGDTGVNSRNSGVGSRGSAPSGSTDSFVQRGGNDRGGVRGGSVDVSPRIVEPGNGGGYRGGGTPDSSGYRGGGYAPPSTSPSGGYSNPGGGRQGATDPFGGNARGGGGSRGGDSSGWNSFGGVRGGGGGGNSGGGNASPSYSAPSYSAPRSSGGGYDGGSYNRGGSNNGGGYSGGGYNGGSRGGGYSAPSYSAPSYSAPSRSAPSYSAPSGGGGGGARGGGAAPSGGHGGGGGGGGRGGRGH